MNFNIYNSIILAGVIQGVIFGAVVLFSKKYKHKSIYFLVALIISYSINNFQWYLEDIGYYSLDQFFKYWYIPLANLNPVLLYFYVIFYLHPNRQKEKREFYLFIPFLVSLGLSIIYKITINNGDTYFTDGLRLYLSTYDELLSSVFHIIIFLVLFKAIFSFEKNNNAFSESSIILYLKWLKVTISIMFILTILWIVLSILYVYFPGQVSFYPLWIAIALTIYWLGHIGIYKYGIVEEQKNIRKKRKLLPPVNQESKTKHIIIERLKQFLEDEKRFLDPELTLEKTAEGINLSQGHLSKIINTELQISFKDYINTLRVEEAKSYLIDSDFSNYTLVAIGLEAGFNSKSAFNASFKKITGETPSQFKQKYSN